MFLMIAEREVANKALKAYVAVNTTVFIFTFHQGSIQGGINRRRVGEI
jgi:hypothetical protein